MRMTRRILFLAALFAAFYLTAEPIDDATFRAVMLIADQEGVPRSVAARLMFEESGDPLTGSRGNPKAFNREPSGFQSQGLFQLHTKPSNIDHLLSSYWYNRTREKFDIWNPRHNATVALRYLADLHRRLGSWYMAACFYNCGTVRAIPERTKRYAKRVIEASNP